MVFVIISAEIDLSVGSMMGLLGGVAAICDVWLGWPLPLTIIVTLVLGLLLGAWNGWWVAYRKVPSFIVTLAGMLAFRGILIGITNGTTVSPTSAAMSQIGQSYLPASTGFIIGALGLMAFVGWQWRGRMRRQALGDRKRDGIVPVMAVGKNITLAALNKFTGGISQLDDAAEQKCILESIQQLKVKTSSPDLAIGRLSGGNQQKAILARCLLLNPRILILDEPTRGIDIGAKYEIYKLINQLVQQGIAVIVISSELPEVLGLSDRVLVMHEGKLKANLINHNLTQEQVMEAALRSEHHVEKQSV